MIRSGIAAATMMGEFCTFQVHTNIYKKNPQKARYRYRRYCGASSRPPKRTTPASAKIPYLTVFFVYDVVPHS